ncbi:hypothetical protein CHLRE_10g438350v5 [Chlamydomonas reinhardtii]|uniref:Uncharacterized protein n=1 Tax=Chlamydomonas reinhardtii TaxID=3055 RepID=A0A2K3DAB8_CHLRE|nr:uncharacterized protein CHLRE_10g438350v5 [Chlamydomonas reinhardtii]PNW77478.1 hypothetical protein CHLRE_10g438350v5 [Chlamydomonas reinhardtii]
MLVYPDPVAGTGSKHVFVRPPAALGGGGSHGCWPTTAFQALLVASEYCAAVQELLAWAFPSPTWDLYKPVVAQCAADFISSAAPVPPPVVVPGLDPVLLHCSHSLWSNFTFLYFHGTRDLNLEGLGTETRQAAQWLKRLVGDRGWAPDGQVFSAARSWAERTRDRLTHVCMSIPGIDTPLPSTGGGTPVEVEALHRRTWAAGCQERKVDDTTSNDKPYRAMFPLRITNDGGKDKANRLRFTMLNQEIPRRMVNTRCGLLPEGFTPTKNCTLGFLVLSDVIQAFEQSYPNWNASKERQDPMGHTDEELTVLGFYGNVIIRDTNPLSGVHGVQRYAHILAGCCQGWAVALEQARGWVNAAAAALPDAVEVATSCTPPQLVLPASLTPAVIQAMAAVVQQVPVAAQPQPQPPQPQVPQPQPQLQLATAILQSPAQQQQPQHSSVPLLPHLTVQLPGAASSSPVPSPCATGPTTDGSGGSGAGGSKCRSPFALQQQLTQRHQHGQQQLPWPGQTEALVLSPASTGAARGPSTQPPGLPPPSPSAVVAGRMGSLSLESETIGESTMNALARDLAETAAGLMDADAADGGYGEAAPPPPTAVIGAALVAPPATSKAIGASACAAQPSPAPEPSHASPAGSRPPAAVDQVTQALGLLSGAAGMLDPCMQGRLGVLLQELAGLQADIVHTQQPPAGGAERG